MKQYLDGMAIVVRQAIVQDVVTTAASQINSANDNMKAYLNAPGESSKFLLDSVILECGDVRNRLAEADVAIPGLGGYVTATSVRLSALQELAKLDARQLQTVRDETTEARDHTRATLPLAAHAIAARFGQIEITVRDSDGFVISELPISFPVRIQSFGSYTFDGDNSGRTFQTSLSDDSIDLEEFQQAKNQQKAEIMSHLNPQRNTETAGLLPALSPIEQVLTLWIKFLQ